MTKISIYQIDEYVTADDKWIGTDVNTYNKTKNFTPRKVATYFNGSQVINTGVDLLYKYFTITPPEDRPAGTLSFETEIGATVDFSAISTFLLSKTTLKGNDVSEFLDFLVNSTSLIYKAKNINIFGSYKIVSVETYFLDSNFFVVTVDFLDGNGFIEEDEDYMISVVDLDKTIPVPQLVKETFEYESSNSFVVANEINNVLQVIVNTTSLHPEGYSYTLPSTVTIINELHTGDVITVVYNYLEEFLEVPNLQRVTNIGNHTTNNIIIDNIPGEYGSYTVTNTLNDLGTFQSYTSPTNIDYQSVYAAYEMSINEIYSPTINFEMFIGQGIMQTSYTNGSDNTAARLYSGNSVNGASLYIEKNDVNGQLKIDDLTDNITLQFPDKPLGTYTIATTLDIPAPLPQATTSVSGYLSSIDWTTFNGKANVNSQVFTGTPSLPTGTIGVTQTAGTNNTTLATTAFATTALNGKMNNPSLTASYIPKALTATTIGNSRLLDTGAYLGIETVNAPTKDITLGYQANREIGIELSDSTTIGRDLIVTAGKTINYNLNSDYNLFISTTSVRYWGMANMIDGGILVNNFGGGGTFKIDLNATTLSSVATGGTGSPTAVCQNSNGDIYQIQQGSGIIFKKLSAGTVFVDTGINTVTNFGSTSFSGSMTAGPDGQIYVFCNTGVWVSSNDGVSYTQLQTTVFNGACKKANGEILAVNGVNVWKRTGGSGLFINTGIATVGTSITETPNGNVFVSVWNGGIWMQTGGSGAFTNLNQPVRLYNGIASDSNGNVFVCVDGGGFIYKQNNATVGTADLQGGTLKLYSGTGKGTGASDIELHTGQKTVSGTDMQTATLRAKINNEGLMTLPSVTNALIDADTTGKAVVTKEYVNNRLVVETTSGYTLTNADSGGIIIFKTTAAQTLTIPTGLADGFECTFVTLSGVTLTVVSTGNTLNNATSTTMLPQLSFTLKRMLAANTYIVAGSL